MASRDDHLIVEALPRDLKRGTEIYYRPHDWVTVTDITRRSHQTSGGYHRTGSSTRYTVHYRRADGIEDAFYAAPNRRLQVCARHKPPEGAEE